MREQIAQQPPATPRRPSRSRPIDIPAWLSKLDTLEHDKISPEVLNGTSQAQSPEKPRSEDQQAQSPAEVGVDRLVETPTISTPVEEPAPSKIEPLTEQDDIPLDAIQLDMEVSSSQSEKKPLRELRVKIWNDEETTPPASNEEEAPEENTFEDLPTRPLMAEHPEQDTARISLPPPILGVQTPPFEEVAELDTVPLFAQHQVRSVPESLEEDVKQAQLQPGDRTALQGSINYISTPPAGQPAIQAAQETPGVTPALRPWEQLMIPKAPTPVLVPQARRPKSPIPQVLTLMLVCLLVLGGIGAWLYIFQPFSIPQVTQPQQDFQSSRLGMSLSYPSGWSVKEDQKLETVTFSDSTHTAQFSVVVVPANGKDAGQYMLQEATQLGITGARPGTTLSFAQAMWQQIQGSVQQNGANYTETLLVTTHGNSLFSLIQQAPQRTYADEEAIIFAGIRSSFRFLS